MANTKKHPSKLKKPVSFSIETKIMRDFRDNCELNGLVQSNIVQILIDKWNKGEINSVE